MTPLVAIGVVRRVDRLARLTDLQLCAVFKFEGDPDEEQRFRRRAPLRDKIGDRNSYVVDPATVSVCRDSPVDSVGPLHAVPRSSVRTP